jgi:hypothetical protein
MPRPVCPSSCGPLLVGVAQFVGDGMGEAGSRPRCCPGQMGQQREVVADLCECRKVRDDNQVGDASVVESLTNRCQPMLSDILGGFVHDHDAAHLREVTQMADQVVSDLWA